MRRERWYGWLAAGLLLAKAVPAAPAADGRMVVDDFAGQAEPGAWTVESATAARWSWRKVERACRLEVLGPAVITLVRHLPPGTAPRAFERLRLRGRLNAGSLKVSTTSAERPAAAVDWAGEEVRLPLSGRVPDELRLTFTFAPRGKYADRATAWFELRGVDLLPAEQVRLAGQAYPGRAVVLRWERPDWGAERYYVVRSREPISTLDHVPVIAAGRPAVTPWLVDFPPLGGVWYYAVAPIEGRALGSASQVQTVVDDGPTVTLPLLPAGTGAGAGVVVGLTGRTAGQPEVADDDLSAQVRLAHDGRRLLVAAEVTDDRLVVGPDGDRLALSLQRFDPVAGGPRLVWTLTMPAQGEAWTATAQGDPVVPGGPVPLRQLAGAHVTQVPRPGGYTLTAEVPADGLVGLDLAHDDWVLVSLQLIDQDGATPAKEPHHILRWPASQAAGLCRVQHYP